MISQSLHFMNGSVRRNCGRSQTSKQPPDHSHLLASLISLLRQNSIFGCFAVQLFVACQLTLLPYLSSVAHHRGYGNTSRRKEPPAMNQTRKITHKQLGSVRSDD
jgi:hypothetical protein